MCVPGTIEAVRSQVEQVKEEAKAPRLDRRTALLLGAGTALAAALPGGARAAGRGGGKKAQDLTHLFRVGIPDVPGCPPALARDACDRARQRLLRADLELLGAHGNAPRRARALHRRRPHDAAAHARRADGADRRDRHLRARCARPGHRRHDRRPAPLRARARKDQAWLTRGDELGVGRSGGQRGGVPEHGRIRDDALPRLERRRDRVADRRAQASGRSGSTHSASIRGTRPRSSRMSRSLSANRFGIENLANLGAIPPKGATAFVGVIPWEEGSGGPARVVATW